MNVSCQSWGYLNCPPCLIFILDPNLINSAAWNVRQKKPHLSFRNLLMCVQQKIFTFLADQELWNLVWFCSRRVGVHTECNSPPFRPKPDWKRSVRAKRGLGFLVSDKWGLFQKRSGLLITQRLFVDGAKVLRIRCKRAHIFPFCFQRWALKLGRCRRFISLSRSTMSSFSLAISGCCFFLSD